MKVALLICLGLPCFLAADEVEFNRDIRPILSDRCFACHGPDAANRKTRLRFDLEASALKEGAVVPGDPQHSKLFLRISSTNDAQRMPPAYAHKDKLSAKQIELMRAWIEQGAKWQPFWSFAAPRKSALPSVTHAGLVRNPIDRFILSRLEREGLYLSPEADPEALIRRVSLDLTGLPPTPVEVDAFLNDKSPDAYSKVVDRLLASPRYGERMAFRWMEAARYGDTNGYQTDGERDMWRWRDWVIGAFNRNMHYDEFTIDQIAGDLLPHPTREQVIATGFNRNQRTSGEGGIIPEEYRVEYVADRAQTTSTVWLGLTTGCARCHDHKFDPIYQKDFYRLFAYFNQIPEERGFAWNYGNEEPLVKAPLPEQEKHLAQLDETLAKAQAKFESHKAELLKARKPVNPGWLPADDLVFHSDAKPHEFDGWQYTEMPGEDMDFGYMQPVSFAAWIKPETNDGAIMTHQDDYFESPGHGVYLVDGKIRFHLIFRWTDLGIRVETAAPVELHKWQHVTVTYDGKRRAAGVRIYIDSLPQETRVLFDHNNEPIKKKDTPFRIGAGGGERFLGAIGSVRVYRKALAPIEVAVLAGRPEAEQYKAEQSFMESVVPDEIAHLKSLQVERDAYEATLPTVMVMADSAQPRQTFLLKRGAYDDHGEPVAPGVPAILPQFQPGWPNNRLGLARWLVDRSNPLTARVTVNRFWQSYFGVGIVKTVDDFGSQGEWPVHPELLDWLATEFMDSGWDMKSLQKTIVMSATYRQSSKVTPQLLERDPENRLLARGPRLRLGPEVIRDQALFVSGLLVEKQGGPSVKPYQPAGLWQELAGGKGYVEDKGEGLYRRSLYTYWKRTVVPPFMANFDSPNREQCAVFENRTNSPLQALDLMNDVTFLEASRKLAERMIAGGETAEQRIDFGYRLVLNRKPDAARQLVLQKALSEFAASYTSDRAAAKAFLSQGRSPQASRIDPVELASYTAIASLLLNLDETITKE